MYYLHLYLYFKAGSVGVGVGALPQGGGWCGAWTCGGHGHASSCSTLDLLDWCSLIDSRTELSRHLVVPNMQVTCPGQPVPASRFPQCHCGEPHAQSWGFLGEARVSPHVGSDSLDAGWACTGASFPGAAQSWWLGTLGGPLAFTFGHGRVGSGAGVPGLGRWGTGHRVPMGVGRAGLGAQAWSPP